MSDQCYADDFVLFAPSAKATQRFLNICSTYANEHGTIFNSLKTACMVFCPRCLRNLNVRKFTFDGVELEFREEVTYSGHVNHNYLKDGLYIRKQLQKFNAAWNLLVRKFTVCSKKVKWTVSRAHCCSVHCGYLCSLPLFTASVHCGYLCLNLIQCLSGNRVCDNDILRELVGVPRLGNARALLPTVHLNNMDVILRKLSYRFRSRI